MEPIVSVNALAHLLGFRAEVLKRLADEADKHYRPMSIVKKDGTTGRRLRVPGGILKEVQKRIRVRILAHCAVSQAAHGSVKGRSIRTNASAHVGQPRVLNMDVREFFPSVRNGVVYRMFRRHLAFGRDVARLLTRLTTVDAQLPQGAPTSPAVANLVLYFALDRPLLDATTAAGAKLTRYMDDVTISGEAPTRFVHVAAQHLSKIGLRIFRDNEQARRRGKFIVTGGHEPQAVTGLNVNSAHGPSVPRKRRDAIRASIFHLPNVERPLPEAVASIRGQIAFVGQFNPGAAARLTAQLEERLRNLGEIGFRG